MGERLPPLGRSSGAFRATEAPLEKTAARPDQISAANVHPLLPPRAQLEKEDADRLLTNLVEALQFAAAKAEQWPSTHGPLLGRLSQALDTARAITESRLPSIPPRARELLSALNANLTAAGAKGDQVRALLQAITGALPATLSQKIALAPGGVERVIEGPWGRPVREITHAYVTLEDGTKLKARLWLPMNASPADPCPVVVEALPYGAACGTVKRDWINATRLAGEGIGWARVDLRGSGESTGSMSDEYTAQEQHDIVEVLGALSEQPWSTGKTALVGNSWGAFNGAQVAGLHPESLAAVIMSCGSEDRYADDVHYKGGMIVGEQLVYGNSFLAFVGRPPDPQLVGDDWREMWIERMSRFEPPLPVWLSHPDRTDGYWDTPSDRPERLRVPVLAVGGFADSYSNSVPRVVNANASARGIIGPGGHGYPHLSRPSPTFPFLDYASAFLKDAFAGRTSAQPDLIVFMESAGPPHPEAVRVDGRWVAIADARKKEEIATRVVKLDAHAVSSPGQGALGAAEYLVKSPQTLGVASGKFCPFGVPGQLPADQRPDDAQSLSVDIPIADRPLELVGAPAVKLKLSSDLPEGNLIVRLSCVAPDGASTRLSYGVLNLAHRDGSDAPKSMVPGKEYEVRVQLDDLACSIPAGYQLRIGISNAYWPMFWPSAGSSEEGRGESTDERSEGSPALKVKLRGSSLELPEYRAETAAIAMPEATLPRSDVKSPTQKLRDGGYSTVVDVDPVTGRETTTVVDDSGAGRDQTGMVSAQKNVQRYSIDPNDPLSARAECTWSTEFERGDWRTSVVATTVQTSTRDYFIVESSLKMSHGEEVVLDRKWRHEIPRARA